MLLLRFSSVGVVRQVEANVGVVWVGFDWRGFYRSSVRSRIADGQDRPAVKRLAGRFPSLRSCRRKHCHFPARSEIHSVDGKPVISWAYQKRFRNGLRPVGLFGLPTRKHASAEILRPMQWRQPVTQGSAAKETPHPTPATAPSGIHQVKQKNHRSAAVGFPHVWTHNIPLRHGCSPGSVTRPSQRAT